MPSVLVLVSVVSLGLLAGEPGKLETVSSSSRAACRAGMVVRSAHRSEGRHQP